MFSPEYESVDCSEGARRDRMGEGRSKRRLWRSVGAREKCEKQELRRMRPGLRIDEQVMQELRVAAE